MTKQTKTLIAIVVFVAFLAIVYWGYTALSQNFKPQTPTANNSDSGQTEELQTAPDFTVFDQDGNPVKLSDFAGKPVVLNFWASWCPSCRTEVPKINQLAAKYGERGMAFVAINVGFNDSVERAQAFARKTGMTYPAIFDGSGQITEPYQLIGVPTIIIADNKGVIQYRNFATPEITEEHFSRLNAN